MKGNKEKGSSTEDWRRKGYGRDCEGSMDRIAKDKIRENYPGPVNPQNTLKKINKRNIGILRKNCLKGRMRNDRRNAEWNG